MSLTNEAITCNENARKTGPFHPLLSSLWIDYVPTESNPADVPSRVHAMGAEEAEEALKDFGVKVRAVIPSFADEVGEWLPSVAVAASVWGN